MEYSGIWKNRTNDADFFRLVYHESDDYFLQTFLEGPQEFTTAEKISIYKTNQHHAFLPASSKFGNRRNIIVLSENTIQIADAVYDRAQD